MSDKAVYAGGIERIGPLLFDVAAGSVFWRMTNCIDSDHKTEKTHCQTDQFIRLFGEIESGKIEGGIDFIEQIDAQSGNQQEQWCGSTVPEKPLPALCPFFLQSHAAKMLFFLIRSAQFQIAVQNGNTPGKNNLSASRSV
jgi:hypothetical protein